jgi:hypothetical protein
MGTRVVYCIVVGTIEKTALNQENPLAPSLALSVDDIEGVAAHVTCTR